MKRKTIKCGLLRRMGTIECRADTSDGEESREVALAFSSEEPVDRWFGVEVLDHAKSSVRLGRMNAGGALLVDHDPRDHVGVIETASVGNDRVGRAVARLGQSPRAEEILRDVRDGIRRHISVGYRVHKMTLEEETDSETRYRITDWEPYEISLVSVPADATVGVGRGSPGEFEVTVEDPRMTDEVTSTKDNAPAPAVTETRATPTVVAGTDHDAERAATDARDAERKRVAELNANAKLYPQTRDLADQAILEGWPIDRYREQALPLISGNPAERNDKPVTEIGMSDKEVKRFSLMAAIRALVRAKAEGADPAKVAPFEIECSRAVAEKLDREPRGILVPYDVQQRTPWLAPRGLLHRAPPMDTTENVHLVGTDHLAANFIDALRARTVLLQAGAIMLDGLVGNVSIPKLAGSSAYAWVAEDGPSVDNDPATATVALTPGTVTSSVSMTRRLLLQSAPSVEAIIRNDLVAGAAIALDNGGINGDANGPTGLLNETGVGTVPIADFAAGAGVPTWAEAVQFETVVDTALALGGMSTYVTTPSVSGGMKTAPKDSGSGLFVQEGMECNGYPVARTTLMAAKTILFGDYSQCLIGMWGALDINVDVATKAASGGIVLRAFLDADVTARHGEAFAKSVA